jgi:hypothetical protein
MHLPSRLSFDLLEFRSHGRRLAKPHRDSEVNRLYRGIKLQL